MIEWMTDFAEGILRLIVSHYAMLTFSKVPHSNIRALLTNKYNYDFTCLQHRLRTFLLFVRYT